MSIEIEGMERALREFRNAPTLVTRAQRNAVSAMVTESRKQITNTIHSATGLKKKQIRQRLPTTRPKRDDITGTVRPTARTVFAKDVRHRFTVSNPAFPTRASFEAKSRLGRFVKYAGFVNPRGAKRRPLIETKRGIVPALGGTLRAVFQEIVDPQFKRATEAALRQKFRVKLDRQITRQQARAR